MTFSLTSPAFASGERIPDRHVRDGDNLSPPLEWSGAPEGTQGFALMVEDPDAPSGTFRHWGVHGIPADRTRLDEGAGAQGELRHCVNDFANAAYDGPQPPQGHGPHRYYFRLAALDVATLEVADGTGAGAMWDEALRHVLGEAELFGTYER